HQAFEFPDLQIRFRNSLQQAHVVEAVGGYFFRMHYFRLAQKIALEVNKTSRFGEREMFSGFNLFDQHPAPPGAVSAHQGRPVLACMSIFRMSARSANVARGSSIVKSSSAIM